MKRRSFLPTLLSPLYFLFPSLKPKQPDFDGPQPKRGEHTWHMQGEWEVHRLALPGMEVDMDFLHFVFDQDTGHSYLQMRARRSLPPESGQPTLNVPWSHGSYNRPKHCKEMWDTFQNFPGG